MRVRTGRFTRRKHTKRSGITVGLHPEIPDRNEPLGLQPLIGHPGLGCQRSRQVPVAFAADRRQDRLALARSQTQQVLDLGTHVTPLFPVAHPHPASQPVIKFRDRAVAVRNAKVTHPTAEVLGELMKPVSHRDAPTASGQFPDLVLEVLEGSVGPAQLGSPEGETEKFSVIGLNHPALLLIDHQFELGGQKARHAVLDPLACPLTLNEDQQVVRITDEPMAPPFQFLVQIIQEDISEQGGKRTALRRPQCRGLNGFSDQDRPPADSGPSVSAAAYR